MQWRLFPLWASIVRASVHWYYDATSTKLNWLCKYVASNLIWESTYVHMAVWYSARQMVLKSSPYSLNNLSFCFSFTPSHKMQKNIPFWAKYCPMHISIKPYLMVLFTFVIQFPQMLANHAQTGMGSFTNYVDNILAFFDHLHHCTAWHFLRYKRWQKVDILRPPNYLIL